MVGVRQPLAGALPLAALQQLAFDVQRGLLVLVQRRVAVLEQRLRILDADDRLRLPERAEGRGQRREGDDSEQFFHLGSPRGGCAKPE